MKNEFLNLLKKASEVTLVGPLYSFLPPKVDHPFIYVDRGIHFKEEIKKSAKKGYVDFSVGDGDSSEFPLDIMLPKEKDYSDLKFALGLLPGTLKKVSLWGFLGGRRDHEIINFGEIQNLLSSTHPKTLFSFEDKVLGNAGSLKINIYGIFSLVLFQPTEIKIEGKCQYQIPNFLKIQQFSSHGLSNKGDGEVVIEARGPFFLFLN